MGYETSFKLRIKPVSKDMKDIVDAEQIKDRLETLSTYDFYSNTCDYSYMTEGKWYDFSDHMKQLSTEFPNCIFQLDGDGEETDDQWRIYYYQGKSQTAKLTKVYEDYDESKLK